MASLIIRGVVGAGAAGAYVRLSVHRAIDTSGPCLVYNPSRRDHLFVCRNASAEAARSGLQDTVNRDMLLAEMEDLEQEFTASRTHRKAKKLWRPGARRLDSIVSSEVEAKAQKRGFTSKGPGVDFKSDEPKLAGTKARGRGVKVKSSIALKLQAPPINEKLLTRKDWEEQAYKIIRQQKLRDATLANTGTRMGQQSQKGFIQAATSEAATSTVNLGQHDSTSVEDVKSYRISKNLGFDDKCQPLVAYLHTLGLREGDFIRIVDRHKACLQANLNVVKERVEFLLSVGVKVEHLPKLIVRHPQILEYRVEQAMKPRVCYLKSLGLDESKIGKIITISPSLLECSLERSIKPRVAYLTHVVGIDSQDIGKIVMRSPQILTQSIDDSIKPRVDFFINEIKLSKEALAKMVTRHPQLLHYSLEDGIKPHVRYLRNIGMSDDDILKVLTRLTQILSLSIRNCLQPKYGYLVRELNGSVRTVTTFPAYFSLSLEQRIIPRHKYLQMLEKVPEGPFPMRLLTISDAAFCKWAKSSVEAYEKFRHDLLLSTFPKKFELKHNVLI